MGVERATPIDQRKRQARRCDRTRVLARDGERV
jgi:hypothetical protein